MTQVFIASLATETNSFAPFPTGRAGFEAFGIVRNGSQSGEGFGGSALAAYRAGAEAAGYDIIESISAFAQPAGKTVRTVYEELRDIILADLDAAGGSDMVLLALHGAMIAQGYDDCEGDLIARVRARCPEAVIGVELDPHCHLSAAMVEAADVIITFKEYPHVDIADRARDLFRLCDRTLRGEIRPVAALVDTRMVGFYPTFDQPMRGIVDAAVAAEAKPGILSASIAHGFPWADVADLGTRVLVYADGDGDAASQVALDLAERLYAVREVLRPDYPAIAESLDRVAALDGCVVLGDYADNAGGGAPSDSTFFLRALVDRGIGDAAIGCFHDPAVAQIAADAGVGAILDVRLGGKSGPASGDPIDLTVEVMAIAPAHSQQVFDVRLGMGLTVWLRHAGIDILVNSVRSQIYGTDLFTGIGIDLAAKRLIVVKSSSHYEAAFTPIADHIWRVVSPGALALDFERFPYTQRDPVYFPRVADPWAEAGRPVPIRFEGRG